MEAIKIMFDTNVIGTMIIVTMLVVCIVGCALVVYDTGRDTIREVRSLLKNRKTKN